MIVLATQLKWIDGVNPLALLLLGAMVGWIAGLLWWWYLSERPAAGGVDVKTLQSRLHDAENARSARDSDVLRLEKRLRDVQQELEARPATPPEAPPAAPPTVSPEAIQAEILAALEADRVRHEADVGRLEEDLRVARSAVAEASAEHAECDARLSRLDTELEAIRSEKDAAIARLKDRLETQSAEGESTLGAHAAALLAATSARDAAATRATELERELAGVRGELDGALARCDQLASERDTALARADLLVAECDKLGAERDAAQGRADQLAASAGATAGLESQLASYRRERDEARRDARRQALDMQREFEESTRAAAEEIARLREERKEMQRQLRLAGGEVQRLRDVVTRGGDSEAEAERLRARLSDEEGRHLAELRKRDDRIDELLARVTELEARTEQPPVRPPRPARDDLQRIHGVGPVLERQLHALGVLRFEDIAAWRRKDIEAISEHLDSFPDRIERDAWVAQARELAEEMRRDYTG